MVYQDFNKYYPEGEEVIGFLFLGDLIYINIGGKFELAGVEIYDCRVAGNHSFIMDSSEQEWPLEDDYYS